MERSVAASQLFELAGLVLERNTSHSANWGCSCTEWHDGGEDPPPPPPLSHPPTPLHHTNTRPGWLFLRVHVHCGAAPCDVHCRVPQRVMKWRRLLVRHSAPPPLTKAAVLGLVCRILWPEAAGRRGAATIKTPPKSAEATSLMGRAGL